MRLGSNTRDKVVAYTNPVKLWMPLELPRNTQVRTKRDVAEQDIYPV